MKKYRGMIGSLLYLTASRSDIMFSICMCPNINWPLRNLISKSSNMFLGIFMVLRITGFGIPKGVIVA